MVNGDKIKDKSLYSPWTETLPDDEDHLDGTSINEFCSICKSNQTFNSIKVVFNGENLRTKTIYKSRTGGVFTPDRINGYLLIEYECAKCHEEHKIFLLDIKEDGRITKIGQNPPLNCEIPKEISSLSYEIVELYKKGRVSETHGYGIGAFAYYRRIIELEIDNLISSIKEIIPKSKIKDYEKLVKEIKKKKNAEEKIELVKNTILDESLGGNPLSAIYDLLSRGIHTLKDEECLECAESLRTLLILILEKVSHIKKNKEDLKKAMTTVDKLREKYKR